MIVINNKDNVADRLTYLFSVLGQKQTDVAKRLHLADASVSNWITGKTTPSGQTIAQICREYSASEEWILTGKGEMFINVSKQEQLNIFFENLIHDSNEYKIDFILALASLPENDWKAIANIISALNAVNK